MRLEWIRNNQSYFTDAQPTLQQLQNGIEGNGGEADLPDDGNVPGLETMDAFEDIVDWLRKEW